MADVVVADRRLHRFWHWNDERDRKKLKLYMITFFPVAIISLCALGFLIYNYGYIANSPQPVTIIWLIFYNCIKLIHPLAQFFESDHIVELGRFECLYIFMCLPMPPLGFLFSAISVIEMIRNTFEVRFSIWILIIDTYVIDLIMLCVFLRYTYQDVHVDELIPLLNDGQIPIYVLNNPKVTTHSYYTVCSICSENFKEGDDVKDLECKHIYHPKCIELWMINHDKCPNCMGKI